MAWHIYAGHRTLRSISRMDIHSHWEEEKRWRKLRNKFLRVTYREENDEIVIISAVLKKRSPEGGER